MCFNQEGAISSLDGGPLKLVDKLMYLCSNISSTESDANMHAPSESLDYYLFAINNMEV